MSSTQAFITDPAKTISTPEAIQATPVPLPVSNSTAPTPKGSTWSLATTTFAPVESPGLCPRSSRITCTADRATMTLVTTAMPRIAAPSGRGLWTGSA